MKKVFVLMGLIGLVILLGSCTQIIRKEGNKIERSQLERIKLGQTTKEEIINLLGEPSKKEKELEGTEKFTYYYWERKSPGLKNFIVFEAMGKTQEEVLEFSFKEGVLQFYRLKSKGEE